MKHPTQKPNGTVRTANEKENKMGTMPVNRLLLSMSLPIIVSMLVQALYNVVDSVYVSRISEDALTAVSLAFPIQNVMIAVAVGTGVGVNAVLAKNLGAKRFDRVNLIAGNGVTLFFISFLAFVLIGAFLPLPYFRFMTDSAEIVRQGSEYIRIVTVASFGLFGQILFERLMQATGKTLFSMFTQGLGALINIILDPFFIFDDFHLFGLSLRGLGMESAGAAVATVIGQCVAFALALFFNQCFNHEVRISLPTLRLKRDAVREIYDVAVPSIAMASVGSVMNFFLNKVLIAFSTTAAAVFGVYFKLQSFIFMPVFGLNNGMLPILSYNFGAQKRKRLLQTLKLGITYAVSFMLCGMLVMMLFPEQLLALFDADGEMLHIGVSALRTISLSFVFAGICIPLGSLFQAVGRSIYSFWVSVARQLVVLVPVAYVLKAVAKRAYEADLAAGGSVRFSNYVNYVWWAFPIAEIMSLTATAVFTVAVFRSVLSEHTDC